MRASGHRPAPCRPPSLGTASVKPPVEAVPPRSGIQKCRPQAPAQKPASVAWRRWLRRGARASLLPPPSARRRKAQVRVAGPFNRQLRIRQPLWRRVRRPERPPPGQAEGRCRLGNRRPRGRRFFHGGPAGGIQPGNEGPPVPAGTRASPSTPQPALGVEEGRANSNGSPARCRRQPGASQKVRP